VLRTEQRGAPNSHATGACWAGVRSCSARLWAACYSRSRAGPGRSDPSRLLVAAFVGCGNWVHEGFSGACCSAIPDPSSGEASPYGRQRDLSALLPCAPARGREDKVMPPSRGRGAGAPRHRTLSRNHSHLAKPVIANERDSVDNGCEERRVEDEVHARSKAGRAEERWNEEYRQRIAGAYLIEDGEQLWRPV
jgi:hypothetical protein